MLPVYKINCPNYNESHRIEAPLLQLRKTRQGWGNAIGKPYEYKILVALFFFLPTSLLYFPNSKLKIYNLKSLFSAAYENLPKLSQTLISNVTHEEEHTKYIKLM